MFQIFIQVFSGNLIHGAAKNNSDEIRFSIDFRILPFRYYNANLKRSFILHLVNLILNFIGYANKYLFGLIKLLIDYF